MKIEDLGGIEEEDLIKHKLKIVEDAYDAQPDNGKNIIAALMAAFKNGYI